MDANAWMLHPIAKTNQLFHVIFNLNVIRLTYYQINLKTPFLRYSICINEGTYAHWRFLNRVNALVRERRKVANQLKQKVL